MARILFYIIIPLIIALIAVPFLWKFIPHNNPNHIIIVEPIDKEL